MNAIEIDFDVYKEITIRRTSEKITPNDVLRELLGLQPQKSSKSNENKAERSWLSKGVTFLHGTKFRSNYKGKVFQASVDNGALVYEGKRFSSPSSAAVSITGNSVNGWIFWECMLPGASSWKIIKDLRN